MDDASKGSRKTLFVLAAITALAAFITYLPALGNGFVNWLDPAYLYKNPMMMAGQLDAEFIRWAVTSEVAGIWHPLTLLSHGVDVSIFGLDPKGHHLVSIIIHALNTFLVFCLCASLVGIARYGPLKAIPLDRATAVTAFVTALFFSLHPLRVESVVWISGRKDLLCALFYLLSLLSYLHYATRDDTGQRALYHIFSISMLALALASNPMAVSLPLILILIDIYPLGRIKTEGLKAIIAEKFPFFALSAATALMAVWAKGVGGELNYTESFPIFTRILNAFSSVIFYLSKTFMPVDLAPYYPYQDTISLASSEFIIPFLVFIIITAISFVMIKRRTLFLSLWLFYLITLLPVIGLIQVGAQAASDRYTYLPSLGPAIIIGLAASRLFSRSKSARAVAIILTIIISVGLSMNARVHAEVWKDSITLWSHQIRLYPGQAQIAYTNRGLAYNFAGRTSDAIKDLAYAIELRPNDPESPYKPCENIPNS